MAQPSLKDQKWEFKITMPTPSLDTKDKTDKQVKAMKRALSRGIQRGGARIETSLKQALDNAMQSTNWNWPRTTLRKNGSTAGRSRDIIDTGKLQKSGKVVAKYLVTKTTMEVRYTAPYARLVHEGGYITPYGKEGRTAVYVPGRPWIRSVMVGENGYEKFEVDSVMNAAISEAWKEQFG